MNPVPTTTTQPTTYLGIDIAKHSLDLSPHPGLRCLVFANDDAGLGALVSALRRIPGPLHVVCEATGGYEHDLVAALHDAGIPVSLLNPRRVRDLARAKGLLAKTDAIDARVLAEYGRLINPAPTPKPTATARRLAELVGRRQELVALVVQERHRAEHHHDAFVARQAARLAKVLDSHLEALEAEISALVESDKVLAGKVARLSQIQGVAARTSWSLLASLPELGTLARGQAASLAGVAPFNHDSGPRRGQRHILHGRATARAALYMAAVVAARCNPVLRPFYLRLRESGKPAKVALVAVMRKLVELANEMLADPGLSIVTKAPKDAAA